MVGEVIVCPQCQRKVARHSLDDHVCEGLTRLPPRKPFMLRPLTGRGARAGLKAIAAKRRAT